MYSELEEKYSGAGWFLVSQGGEDFQASVAPGQTMDRVFIPWPWSHIGIKSGAE